MVEAVTEVINSKNGLTGSIVALCVIFTLFIVLKVVEFSWKTRQEKDSASEKSIKELNQTVEKLIVQLEKMEQTLSSLPKIKEDLRRYYNGLKLLAGNKWSRIRKEITDDEIV